MKIIKEDIKKLAIERNQFLDSQTVLDYDQELIFDSLSLLWFIEGLNEKYALSLKSNQITSSDFQTVNAIFELLMQLSQNKYHADNA
jgi:acyl carrier protein